MYDFILQVTNIDKQFPGVHALKDVSFSVLRGEVHGLIGENGAGKSTLIKSITGAYSYDSGSIIFIDETGTQFKIHNPSDAKAAGIAAAYQDLLAAPELTVGENFFLGRIPKTSLGAVDWSYIYQYSSKILREYGISVDPRKKMRQLTVSQQMMVTIAKLSSEHAKLIIFDEPTALLPNQEVQRFYKILRKLRANGVSMIYVSHRLEEILEVCDRVTVLKDGAIVGTKETSSVTEGMLISMMVGRSMSDIYQINKGVPGAEVLRVEHLTRKNSFSDISFSLHKGEVLGFFGLIGSGRTEVMRCLYGADHYDSGKIFFHGQERPIHSVQDALAAGIGLIPEDRRAQALALGMDVAHNINMADMRGVSRLGIIQFSKYRSRSKMFMSKLKIKAYSDKQIVQTLSGGNQQKVVISKVLSTASDILIMDEPTIGIDIGAKREIYQLVGSLVQDGHSVIFISSYLPELMGVADRVIVFHEGRLMKELSGEDLRAMPSSKTEELILSYASGYHEGIGG